MRKLAALAIAMATLLLGLPGAGVVQAATASPLPLTTPSPTQSEPTLEITSVGQAVLSPDSTLEITATITNPTKDSLTITELQLRSGQLTLSTNTQLTSWMSGTTPSGWLATEKSEIALAPGQTTTRRIRVEAEDLPWPTGAFTWGPRGIEMLAVLDDSSQMSDRSIVVVGPSEEINQTSTSVVVPLTQAETDRAATPTLTELLTEETTQPATDSASPADDESVSPTPTADASGSAAASSSESPQATEESTENADPTPAEQFVGQNEVERIQNVISALPDSGVTFFIDPAFLSHESVTATLADSDADLKLLPMYDSDIAALAHLGNADVAETAVEQAREAARSAGIDADVSTLLPADSLDLDTLEFATEHGFDSVLLSNDMAQASISANYQLAAAAPAADSGLPVDAIVSNEALAAAMSGQLFTRDPGEPPIELSNLDARQATLALSAIQFRERPNDPRGMVVQLPRGEHDASAIAAAKSLLDAPWVDPAGLDEQEANGLSAIRAQDLAQTKTNPGEISVEDFSALALSLERAKNVASILIEPQYMTASADARSLWVTGVGWRGAAGERTTQIDGLDPASFLDPGIVVEESSTINMISESSALPLHVSNSLPLDVRVLVSLETPDTRLRAPQPVEVEIPASSTASVSVPVEAWGSGNLAIGAQVTSQSGVPVGAEQEINVRVRADWENVGTAILAGGVFVLFIFGVVKSVRDGRRSEPVSPETFTANLESANVDN